MPEMRASIYKFPSSFVICPVNVTTTGIGIASAPYQTLPLDISPAELGEAIFRALDASREGIAHPLDWKALAAPRLAAAGVKSEAAFQKKAELVTVRLLGTELSLTPCRNGGTAGNEKGFHPIEESKTHLNGHGRAPAGEAAIERFKFCTR